MAFRYLIRLANPADIPAMRTMQERSMRVIGGDFYTSDEIANFLALCGTMDDAVVEEGHYFVAEDHYGAILGSGGWSRSRPSYAKAAAASEAAPAKPTVRSVLSIPQPHAAASHRRSCRGRNGTPSNMVSIRFTSRPPSPASRSTRRSAIRPRKRRS